MSGGPGRWTLPDVPTGLEDMAAVYATVDTMADQISLFTTLQGLTLLLLILRFIRILSAQKRLSILTTTAVKVNTYHVCVYVICAGTLGSTCQNMHVHTSTHTSVTHASVMHAAVRACSSMCTARSLLLCMSMTRTLFSD